DVPAGAFLAEQHQAELAADRLLVALQRPPGALAVDADRPGAQELVDRRRVAAREAEGRNEAERDRLAVAHALEVGGRLERVREGVAEVEDGALAAVVRVAQA